LTLTTTTESSALRSGITLTNVYDREDRAEILYRLLAERDAKVNISHKEMPCLGDHIRFVEERPYRFWYFVMFRDEVAGACFLTHNNEIGIFIFKSHQRRGLAYETVKLLIGLHAPMFAIPGKRTGHFIAHVSPYNLASAALFDRLGFQLVQRTYALLP
jgi:RimJ/RimL family protein N-acetyltransferase